MAADAMRTLSSSFQSAVVGITAGTGTLLHTQKTWHIESWQKKHTRKIYTATFKRHNKPLLLHSHILLHPPGNRCRSAGLHTWIWCLASWKDTSLLQSSGSSSAPSGCNHWTHVEMDAWFVMRKKHKHSMDSKAWFTQYFIKYYVIFQIYPLV